MVLGLNTFFASLLVSYSFCLNNPCPCPPTGEAKSSAFLISAYGLKISLLLLVEGWEIWSPHPHNTISKCMTTWWLSSRRKIKKHSGGLLLRYEPKWVGLDWEDAHPRALTTSLGWWLELWFPIWLQDKVGLPTAPTLSEEASLCSRNPFWKPGLCNTTCLEVCMLGCSICCRSETLGQHYWAESIGQLR